MHTAAPPKAILDGWLEPFPSEVDTYGHLLLEQLAPSGDAVRLGLTPYFESAHLDARKYFHAFAGISLHPDDDVPGCTARYPNSLPSKTRRGLFGEVMSGLFTQAYEFIGAYEYIVPVFLFRNHEDARQYIFQLAREPSRTREIQGRKGDDFIALVVNEEGKVTRVLAGEAKWRQTWNNSTLTRVMHGEMVEDPDTGQNVPDGRGVWFEINRALNAPIGLRQLQEILRECAKDEFEEVILSLDQILLLKNPDPVERTDLILLAGGGAARRAKGDTLIGFEDVPTEYTAGRDLQVVEMIVSDGAPLIEALYDGLWPAETTADE
ncbi:MAG: aminotransferase [Mesorhizobium sp.]|nr:MAG: aminotransferase [Mesorhizobium sp.]